jgi:hypothetical protein
MKIVRCLRLPDDLEALLMDFVQGSEERLRQSIKTAPKAGQSADELAETLNLNWSAFASKHFPKEVQAKEIPSLFINAPKSTKKESGKMVYAFRHPSKVDEFQKYQAEMQAQWRAFFTKQGVQVDEEAFFRLTGMSGLKPMLGDLSATSAPEQALLSVVEEITNRVGNALSGMEMSALPKFSSDPATDMLLSKYVAEIYGNFASYLTKKYSDGRAGIDAIVSLLNQARGEYLSRTLSHLTGIQPFRQPIANPSQITVAEVKDFLATQKGLPKSEIDALAQRLSEYFGEADGMSSPDVAFLQVYLLDVINTSPNSMKGIGQADELTHIRSAVYRAWRMPQSIPNRTEKARAIIEDLFNKRIPEDTPEPLRKWLKQHGWAEAKPSAPRVESRAEPSAPAKPQPEPAPAKPVSVITLPEKYQPTPFPQTLAGWQRDDAYVSSREFEQAWDYLKAERAKRGIRIDDPEVEKWEKAVWKLLVLAQDKFDYADEFLTAFAKLFPEVYPIPDAVRKLYSRAELQGFRDLIDRYFGSVKYLLDRGVERYILPDFLGQKKVSELQAELDDLLSFFRGVSTPVVEEPVSATSTIFGFPRASAWNKATVAQIHKQLENTYAVQLSYARPDTTAYKLRKAIYDFAQRGQKVSATAKQYFDELPALLQDLVKSANVEELRSTIDGGVFGQFLTDLRNAVIDAQQVKLLTERQAKDIIETIDFLHSYLPEKTYTNFTPIPSDEEVAQALRRMSQVEGIPSAEKFTLERANSSIISLERLLANADRTNRAVAILKRFANPAISTISSDFFYEMSARLSSLKRVLGEPQRTLLKGELEKLPPEIQQGVADWLLSLRRFGEEMAGKGVKQTDVDEFVETIDGFLSVLDEIKPAPAPASPVDEALEQIAQPAPVRAEPEPTPVVPEPAPTVRAEEPTPTPERGRRGRKKAKAEAEAEPPAEPTAPSPSDVPPATPPPSDVPPTPPTTPPPSAGQPIDLPKDIEFEKFGETLRAIMMEYGLPTIRDAKPEYGKMQQLISDYFGSNGALSTIQNTILTALDEMVAVNAVNAHRGIGKSRFFTIQDGRVVLKEGFQDELTAQINALRQAEPLLHFLNDDLIAGFLVLEDALRVLAHSAGDEALEALPFFHNFLAFRLLNPERIDELPTIISTLAGAMKETDAQKARQAVADIREFLEKRVGEQWFQEVEAKLKDIFTTGIISRLITAFFRKSPVLYYNDGRLTEGQWSSWGTFAKRQFVSTLLTNDEAWQTFRANFANPLEVDKLKEGVLTDPVVRHPYLMHALLTYADEAGFNLPALVATADVFRRHIDAMRDLYFKSGISPSTLASIDDFGVNGYRAWLSEVRTALQRQGADDADRALEQALKAVEGVEDDLLGFEVLKTILGFTNDLDGLPALKQVMNNLANVMFALHGFYKKAVVANIGEELLPVLRAFQDEGLIGEVIVPEPNFFSGRSLRKALKEEYGDVDADTAFRYLVDGLPPSVRSIYYTAQTAGKGAEFDLFIPSFVADLIAQPDFLRTRQVWDTLNNIFKSSVIVYNPPALVRNAFTNTMLMWYVGGGNIFRRSIKQLSPYGDTLRPLETGLAEAFSLQREAIREIKAGSKLARDLEAIDPSISLLRTYERLPEWEVINSTDSRAVRGFRWVSNRAFLRSAHAFQTMSETAAKYASVKELLRRWGKLDNYTVDDLIKAVAETNAWLINYRVVPPAVQFMRKYLGLFPFITFQLNTLINFARHPERFYTDLLRGGVYLERLHNLFYFLANDPLTTRYDIRGEQKNLFRLFPEYMRHNPLLVAVPDDRGDVWAMDLTYWLPIGVFETQYDPHPLLGEMPILLPQLATIGWMTDYKDLVRYFGGAIRPFAEAILNKNLLTGQPIYDENLPELEKARAIGGFLVGQVPFLRWLFGMGFGAREVNPVGRTRATDTLFQRGVALMGIRAYHIDALQDARIKELQAKMNELNRTISSLANNPTLSPQRKAELAQMYQEKLSDLQQQLDEQQLVWVPLVIRLDGKTPTYINTSADFGTIMGNLQAKRRLKSREDFFNEAYPPFVPPPMPFFGEEIDLAEAEAMMEEEE